MCCRDEQRVLGRKSRLQLIVVAAVVTVAAGGSSLSALGAGQWSANVKDVAADAADKTKAGADKTPMSTFGETRELKGRRTERGHIGYLGSSTDLNQGYSQAMYNMSQVNWQTSEDRCKPAFVFATQKMFAGSFQIRGIQAAENLRQRWVAPCPSDYNELCKYVNSGPECSCHDILDRSLFVHVKFVCNDLKKSLPNAFHVYDECDTAWQVNPTFQGWDGVIAAHKLQGEAAVKRSAKQYWSIPHHSIVHCDMMPVPTAQEWGTQVHRILAMGAAHNEPPRDQMASWAAAVSRQRGVKVEVIYERDYSTQWFNDLGLCPIFHRNNVTMAIAWQGQMAQTNQGHNNYKPVERMVNPISLGVPVFLAGSHPGFQIATEPLSATDRNSMLVDNVNAMQASIERAIKDYDHWAHLRMAGLQLAKDYSVTAVGDLYMKMWGDLKGQREASELRAKNNGTLVGQIYGSNWPNLRALST